MEREILAARRRLEAQEKVLLESGEYLSMLQARSTTPVNVLAAARARVARQSGVVNTTRDTIAWLQSEVEAVDAKSAQTDLVVDPPGVQPEDREPRKRR